MPNKEKFRKVLRKFEQGAHIYQPMVLMHTSENNTMRGIGPTDRAISETMSVQLIKCG